jgi:hypothetical protein
MASFPLHTTVEDHHTDQPEIRQSSRSEVPSEELHPKHLHGRSRRLPPPGLRGGSGRPECAGQAGRDVQDALSQALTSQRPFLLHLIARGLRASGQASGTHPASRSTTPSSSLTASSAGRHDPAVAALPTPLRVIRGLTRGNRQPCHPVGDRRVAIAARCRARPDNERSATLVISSSTPRPGGALTSRKGREKAEVRLGHAESPSAAGLDAGCDLADPLTPSCRVLAGRRTWVFSCSAGRGWPVDPAGRLPSCEGLRLEVSGSAGWRVCRVWGTSRTSSRTSTGPAGIPA